MKKQTAMKIKLILQITAIRTPILIHTKEVSNRLARAIGHLQKVKQMVENGDDCSDVLIQLAAVKSALNNTGKVILKDHLDHCIVHAVKEGDTSMLDEFNNAIDKFVK